MTPPIDAVPDGGASAPGKPHLRRPRYSGAYPRRFEEKYKERDPQRYRATVEKVLSAGKTPAGTHRPIMVAEILAVLEPRPGQVVVDCTLGYGGHAQELLPKILPGGRLIGLDVDPLELPLAEERLRALGFGSDCLTVFHSNFAGFGQVLQKTGLETADLVLADLGVSSMQLDDPARGFSVKWDGPLDLRMNPNRGQPGSAFLEKAGIEEFSTLLAENADEPRARLLAQALAGRRWPTTRQLADAIKKALPPVSRDEQQSAIRRVFQAVRIAVNDEFSALESFLRNLPYYLKPGGKAAVLTFHSGEDRRVKRAFADGLQQGIYGAISDGVIRPSPAERFANPRSTSAKLRWAAKARA